MLGSRTGRLDSIPLIRASTEDRDIPRRPTPSSARVLRLRACATAAGMLQHSSVFHGMPCVPTCPRPDSNRRRPPPEGGALSAELRWHMPPPRDDARKRPPDRRHAHRTSGTRRPCGMAAFPSVRWCLTRVPRGRGCDGPQDSTPDFPQFLDILPTAKAGGFPSQPGLQRNFRPAEMRGLTLHGTANAALHVLGCVPARFP